MNLVSLGDEQIKKMGERVSLIYQDKEYTNTETREMSLKLAGGLKSLGIGRGDHVGRIPYLLAAGFKGPIYCSEATAVLLPLVLEDAVKIGFTRNETLVQQFLSHIQKQSIEYRQSCQQLGYQILLAD